MSTRPPLGCSVPNMVQRYLGTEYDKVKSVADNIETVTEVADNLDHIKVVENNLGIINTVATDIEEVVVVSSNIADVNSVVADMSYIKTVESNLENIVTVADNITDVVIVSDNIDYVKDVAEGIEGLPVSGYIGDTPPTQPKVGATWYCSLDGRNYTWYEDVDSGQWVESSPQSTIETDPSIAHTIVTNTDNIFALWKRSAAEAGLSLVEGSFEEGGVLTSSNDVLLHKNSKNIYAWTGAFPKVVGAGSTPATTGGIGAGAWVDRTGVSLMDELSETDGVNLVGGALAKDDVFMATTLAELQSLLSSKKKALLVGSVATPTTGLAIPSYAVLEQQNGAIGFIGSTFSANNTISKTGNATITLSNQNSVAGSATVDAVLYQDPAWPLGVVYPQKTTLRNVGIKGDPTTPNQAGIYVLQGGVMSIDSVDVVNCINGLWAKDMFLSDVRKLHTLGKIRIDNGTSMTFTDCWARGHTSREGAFDFTGLKYSTLNGCASDYAPNTAYAFQSCQGVVLNGCGCEGPATITADRGTAIAVKDGNTLVINGFTCVPVAGAGPALITVGNNNKVEIHGWDSNFGKNNSTDIYVYGNGSLVEIWESKFYNGRNPVIQIAVGSTSFVILHKADGNTFKYSAPAAPGPAYAEAFYDKGTWTPALTFGSGSAGLAYSTREGFWEKSGNQVTFHFRITLSDKGTSTGIAVISGAPFVSAGDEAVDFAVLSSMAGGVLHGTVDKDGSSIIMNVRGATGDVNASDTNFTNTSKLRCSYRITVRDSLFC